MTNAGLSPLRGLAKLRKAKTRRFSSHDRTGGNDDRLHIEPGKTVVIEQNFPPGRYGFICFTRDKKDGKPHFLHGMQKEFVIK